MIIKRLLVALVGMLMLAGVTTAVSGPAAAATYPHESRIVFAAQAKSVYTYGDSITITGQVQVSYNGTWYGNDLSPSDSVTVSRRYAGTTTWTAVATVYPSDTEAGKFVFTTSSAGNTAYRFSYSGNQWVEGSDTHVAAPVTADRVIKGRHKATGWGSKSDGKIYLNGRVMPDYAFKKVVLQKRACGTCAWKDYDTFSTVRDGNYRHQVYVPRSGKWYWRVRVPATTRWTATIAPGIYTYRA